MSVARLRANACAQSSGSVTPVKAWSSTRLYPEWQPALKTIELTRLTGEAASSVVRRLVVKSAASALLALKWPARKITSCRLPSSFVDS